MIIYDKIRQKYELGELKSLLGVQLYYKFKNNKPVELYSLGRKLELSDISYSVDEFIEDYPKYNDFVEKASLINVMKTGQTVSGIMKNYHIGDFYKHIKTGFNYNSRIYKDKNDILSLLAIDYDISKFKLEIYKRHVELYGEKEDLEAFREKFSIDHQVLYEKYKEKWHLAFDGLLAEYIKKDINL